MSETNIRKLLFKYLTEKEEIRTLIGTKLYPQLAHEDEVLPYCVYDQSHDYREYTHNGFSGLRVTRFLISCYSLSSDEANNIAETFIPTLERWHKSEDKVKGVFVDSTLEDYEKENKTFGLKIRCRVFYK